MKEKLLWLLVIGTIPATLVGIGILFNYAVSTISGGNASSAQLYIGIAAIVYCILIIMSFFGFKPEEG